LSFGGEAQESWPNDKLNLKPETSQVPSLLCQRQEARKIPAAAAMVITLSAKIMPLILRLLKAAVIPPRNSKDET
jgi:hypothetical protein